MSPTCAIKLVKFTSCTINLLHLRCTSNRLENGILTQPTGSLEKAFSFKAASCQSDAYCKVKHSAYQNWRLLLYRNLSCPRGFTEAPNIFYQKNFGRFFSKYFALSWGIYTSCRIYIFIYIFIFYI